MFMDSLYNMYWTSRAMVHWGTGGGGEGSVQNTAYLAIKSAINITSAAGCRSPWCTQAQPKLTKTPSIRFLPEMPEREL